MTVPPDESARLRAERRRRVQQRQTVIFGGLIAALLVIALISAAMWTGLVPSPLSREFSVEESPGANSVHVCPPEDATPVPLSDITANVLNGTDRAGLAAQTSSQLVAAGVVVNQEGNYAGGYPGATRLVAGPIGVIPAYTLARLFPGSEVILDDGRSNQTIDVILGTEYTAMLGEAEIAELDASAPLEAPEDCTEVDLPEQGEGGQTSDPDEG